LWTSDRVRLAGRRWLVGEGRVAAVVLVHGFCASADDVAVVSVAEALHADGYDVVSYDARGHGDSTGESTLGDLEEHDVAAAVELARTRSDDVVVVGASMGAIAALRYAATDHDLRGVVSVSCPARWTLPVNPTAAAAAVMTRTPFGRAFLSRVVKVRVAPRWTSPVPPVELVTRLQVPLTVVHGTSDRFIPVKASYELYANAVSERSLDLVPRMGHAYDPLATAAIRRGVAWSLGTRAAITAR
jgi:alpha-beta hydrolase superfamily lysophospholipase